MEAMRARPDVAEGLGAVSARVLHQAEGMDAPGAADRRDSGSEVSSEGSAEESDGSASGREARRGGASSRSASSTDDSAGDS